MDQIYIVLQGLVLQEACVGCEEVHVRIETGTIFRISAYILYLKWMTPMQTHNKIK